MLLSLEFLVLLIICLHESDGLNCAQAKKASSSYIQNSVFNILLYKQWYLLIFKNERFQVHLGDVNSQWSYYPFYFYLGPLLMRSLWVPKDYNKYKIDFYTNWNLSCKQASWMFFLWRNFHILQPVRKTKLSVE